MPNKTKLISLFLLFQCFQCSEALGAVISGNVPGVAGTTFTYEENESSFELTFNGGPITTSIDTIFTIGSDWRITIDFFGNDSSNTSPAGDFLNLSDPVISGDFTVIHFNAPHGESPVGTQFCLSTSNCQGPTLNAFISVLTPIFGAIPNGFDGNLEIPHGPHKDFYQWNSNFDITGNEITNWNATITGRHTPEPSSIISLLGLSTFSIASIFKSKLKSSKIG